MKKALIALLSLVMILTCVPSVMINADGGSVYQITASAQTTVVPGQTFNVRYTLTNTGCADGIIGGSIVLTYDEEVFDFDSLTLISAPANWTLENWTKASITSVVHVVFWDETQSSSALTQDAETLPVFDVAFTVKDEVDSQTTSITIVDSFEIDPDDENDGDLYYTEILNAVTTEPVRGTYGSVDISVESGLIVSSSATSYTVIDTDYTTPTLHIANSAADATTKLSNLTANLDNTLTVKVYNKNGVEITNQNQNIGTGAVIKVFYPDNETVLEETTVVVKGDLNGDGRTTAADYMMVRGFVDNGSPSLAGVFFLAGRILSNPVTSPSLTSRDYMKLRAYVDRKTNSL